MKVLSVSAPSSIFLPKKNRKAIFLTITLLAIYIIGFIYFGIKGRWCISLIILTPNILAVWYLISHQILNHIVTHLKKREETQVTLPSQVSLISDVKNHQTPLQSQYDPNVAFLSSEYENTPPTELNDSQTTLLDVEDIIEISPTAEVLQEALPIESSHSILHLPDEMIEDMSDFLHVKDLRKISEANKKLSVYSNNTELERAQEYGFKGNQLIDAKKYLKDLFHLINVLSNSQSIPIEYIVLKNTNDIDSEATFKKLKYSQSPKTLQSVLNTGLIKLNHKIEIVRLLLGFGADVNTSNQKGYTPIICAAFHNNLETAVLLIRSGARINELDNNRNSALYWSIQAVIRKSYSEVKMRRMVKFLLKKGANPHLPAFNGSTPLHFATQYGYVKIATLLLKYGAQINARGAEGNTALNFALGVGDFLMEEDRAKKMVRFLLDKEADLTIAADNGNVPLHIAAQNGYVKIVDLLIERQAEVNIRGEGGKTALCFAFGEEDMWNSEDEVEQMVTLLLKARGDLTIATNNGRLPLHYAAQFGDPKVVACLLENGAKENINARDNRGNTALYLAIKEARYRDKIKGIVQLLLEADADPNIPGEEGIPPLHWAAFRGCCDVVNLLIEHEVDVNYPETYGMTALYFVLRRKGEVLGRNGEARIKELIIPLLTRTNLNLPSGDGYTPLHFAAQLGYFEIVSLLIQHEAQVNLCGPNNKTALDLVLESRAFRNEEERGAMVKLLIEKGASSHYNSSLNA